MLLTKKKRIKYDAVERFFYASQIVSSYANI